MAPFPSPTKVWHDNSYDAISPKRPELSAKGKTVLVTGGGTGIGAETALRFAEAGASRIAIIGRRKQPLLDTKASIERQFPKTEVFTASVDVTDKKAVDAAFASFVGDGKLDVVVSNAAVIGPQEPVGVADAEKFLTAIDINVKGNYYVADAFLRHASADAVVVEINSSAAHVNFGPVFASYSIAKLAVYRLWDTVAFTHPNIRVYHVQPGVVDTEMNKEAGGVKAMGFEDHVSLPANFSVWLASPEARFLKGKYLWANWDVEELKARAQELETTTELNIALVGWPFGEPGWGVKLVENFGSG